MINNVTLLNQIIDKFVENPETDIDNLIWYNENELFIRCKICGTRVLDGNLKHKEQHTLEHYVNIYKCAKLRKQRKLNEKI